MQCFHPKTIYNSGWFYNPDGQYWQKGSSLVVPCGKCGACLETRRKQWFIRLKFEADKYPNQCTFLTLTYDDEHLPLDNQLDKTVFQKFIKRFRKNLGDTKIKYFGCGEYGEKFGRCHYHAIIFGVNPKVCDDIAKKSWSFGFVSSSPVTDARLNYVVEYLQKSVEFKNENTDKVPPFNLCSKGFGLDTFLDYEDYFIAQKGVKFNGKYMPFPRYYRKHSEWFLNYHPAPSELKPMSNYDEVQFQREFNFNSRLKKFKKDGIL